MDTLDIFRKLLGLPSPVQREQAKQFCASLECIRVDLFRMFHYYKTRNSKRNFRFWTQELLEDLEIAIGEFKSFQPK